MRHWLRNRQSIDLICFLIFEESTNGIPLDEQIQTVKLIDTHFRDPRICNTIKQLEL